MTDLNEAFVTKVHKLRERYRAAKHLDTKNVVLHDVIPLITALHEVFVDAIEGVYEDMDSDVVGADEEAEAAIQALHQLVGALLVAGGFADLLPDGGIKPAESFSEELQALYLNANQLTQAWLAAREDDGDEEDSDEEDTNEEDSGAEAPAGIEGEPLGEPVGDSDEGGQSASA